VAECAAHIIAAEQYFRDNISQALKGPVLPAAVQSNAGDSVISKFIHDRSTKVPGFAESDREEKP
jgi:hypothetical protein